MADITRQPIDTSFRLGSPVDIILQELDDLHAAGRITDADYRTYKQDFYREAGAKLNVGRTAFDAFVLDAAREVGAMWGRK